MVESWELGGGWWVVEGETGLKEPHPTLNSWQRESMDSLQMFDLLFTICWKEQSHVTQTSPARERARERESERERKRELSSVVIRKSPQLFEK